MPYIWGMEKWGVVFVKSASLMGYGESPCHIWGYWDDL